MLHLCRFLTRNSSHFPKRYYFLQTQIFQCRQPDVEKKKGVERAVRGNLDNNDTANVSQKCGIWVLR